MADWTKRFALTGKRALVTGASKGIGLEACRALFVKNASPAGREVKAAVESQGRRCVTITADMETAEGPVKAAAQALAAFGTIDILVNNAGIARVDSLIDTKVEDWDAVMAVNLRAPFLLAREVAPAMIRQKAGKIINVSSQAGIVGLDAHGAYCASKGGLNTLTKVMTVEWAKYNIQINTVCPTVILTPMGEKVWGQPEKGDPMKAKIPGGRFGKPIEVADAILFLASSASDMICGHDLLVDGGYTAI